MVIDDESATELKTEIATEMLREDQTTSVTTTDECVTPDAPSVLRSVDTGKKKKRRRRRADTGVSTGFMWYKNDPQLLEVEKMVMRKFFPGFQLEKVEDGRLCWIGTLSPRGDDGGTWTLMVVYDNNHPHNNTYGRSIRVYSIAPDLNEFCQEAEKLPRMLRGAMLRDATGNLYICGVHENVLADQCCTDTAASALAGVAKWLFMIEEWLEGGISDDFFDHFSTIAPA